MSDYYYKYGPITKPASPTGRVPRVQLFGESLPNVNDRYARIIFLTVLFGTPFGIRQFRPTDFVSSL